MLLFTLADSLWRLVRPVYMIRLDLIRAGPHLPYSLVNVLGFPAIDEIEYTPPFERHTRSGSGRLWHTVLLLSLPRGTASGNNSGRHSRLLKLLSLWSFNRIIYHVLTARNLYGAHHTMYIMLSRYDIISRLLTHSLTSGNRSFLTHTYRWTFNISEFEIHHFDGWVSGVGYLSSLLGLGLDGLLSLSFEEELRQWVKELGRKL